MGHILLGGLHTRKRKETKGGFSMQNKFLIMIIIAGIILAPIAYAYDAFASILLYIVAIGALLRFITPNKI
jgi:hypothetical protein